MSDFFKTTLEDFAAIVAAKGGRVSKDGTFRIGARAYFKFEIIWDGTLVAGPDRRAFADRADLERTLETWSRMLFMTGMDDPRDGINMILEAIEENTALLRVLAAREGSP